MFLKILSTLYKFPDHLLLLILYQYVFYFPIHLILLNFFTLIRFVKLLQS